MKIGRQFPADLPLAKCPLFERDLATLHAELLANPVANRVEVDTVECGCCCADVPFQEMVQVRNIRLNFFLFGTIMPLSIVLVFCATHVSLSFICFFI